MQAKMITIVGMGRTGVSIAMALNESAANFTVIGHDSNADLLRESTISAALDQTEADLVNACAPADIIVLAMPAVDLEPTFELIGAKLQSHTLVIDLTALKEPGIRFAEKYLENGHYVGARPVFAAATFDDLQTNYHAARTDLFRNSVFCVMPSVEADAKAVETTVMFGRLLGAKPYFVDPLEYDQLSLGVETMPGAAAAALFRSIMKTAGWRDILRFADLPFAIGTLPLDTDELDLAYHLLHDREGTLRWLDGLASELAQFRRFLEQADQDILSAYLAETNIARRKWLLERRDNDWEEAKTDVELPSLTQHFLGSLATRRKEE
jgi:prephenate dehydrogenase